MIASRLLAAMLVHVTPEHGRVVLAALAEPLARVRVLAPVPPAFAAAAAAVVVLVLVAVGTHLGLVRRSRARARTRARRRSGRIEARHEATSGPRVYA